MIICCVNKTSIQIEAWRESFCTFLENTGLQLVLPWMEKPQNLMDADHK